jgi:hypothetical protein
MARSSNLELPGHDNTREGEEREDETDAQYPNALIVSSWHFR